MGIDKVLYTPSIFLRIHYNVSRNISHAPQLNSTSNQNRKKSLSSVSRKRENRILTSLPSPNDKY